MIIIGLLNIIYNVLNVVLSPFHVPSFGSDTLVSITDLIDMLFETTEDFIGLLLPWGLVKVCLGIIVVVLLVIEAYKLIMWILRKIPMLGIQ